MTQRLACLTTWELVFKLSPPGQRGQAAEGELSQSFSFLRVPARGIERFRTDSWPYPRIRRLDDFYVRSGQSRHFEPFPPLVMWSKAGVAGGYFFWSEAGFGNFL